MLDWSMRLCPSYKNVFVSVDYTVKRPSDFQAVASHDYHPGLYCKKQFLIVIFFVLPGYKSCNYGRIWNTSSAYKTKKLQVQSFKSL